MGCGGGGGGVVWCGGGRGGGGVEGVASYTRVFFAMQRYVCIE